MSDDRRPTVNLAAVSVPQKTEDFEAPRLLSDPVPALRGDLRIDPKPGSAGLFEVGPLGEDRRFTLYDFEVSIARMLDGKRPVSDLIDAAGRIGIPITLESFRKFARQMNAYGFLASATPDGAGPWAPREQWRPEVRELFQGALRTSRMDRPQEALGYLDAIEEIEQGLPEVAELRARIEEQMSSGAEAVKSPTFAELHGDELFDDTAPKPGTPGEPAQAHPGAAGIVTRLRTMTGDLIPLFSNVTKPRGRRAPLAIAIGALALIAGTAVPLPSKVNASARLSPSAPPAVVKSPREGRIAELSVPPGSWVEAGQTIARLDQTELTAKSKALEEQLQTLDAQIAGLEERAQTRSAKRAAAALEKAQKALASIQARHDRLAARGATRSAAKLEKKLHGRERTVERAKRKLDRLTHADQLAEAQAQRTQQAAALEGLKQALAQSTIVASTAGVFQTDMHSGNPVAANAAVGTLVDTRALVATLAVPPSAKGRVKPGAKVTLHLGTTLVKAKVDAVAARGDTAEVRLKNPQRKLPANASGSAEIDSGTRSLLARLL